MKKQTVYIIGAGAIGKALAVFLSLNGCNTVLIRGSVNDGSDGEEEVNVQLNDGSLVGATLRVSTLQCFDELDGLVVMANKSFANNQLAEAVYPKIKQSPVIILQNGIDVERAFINKGFLSVYRCVLFATCQPVSTNHYRFKPVTASPIGVVQGSTEELKQVIAILNNAYFPFVLETNIVPVVWTKAIINCAFNSICPLLEVDNGIFRRNEEALSLARSVIAESVGIARALGILIEERDLVEKLLQISKSSDGQLISTYQDIKSGRRTEIDTLNFAIVDAAEMLGAENRVNTTRLLGELIKLKSDLHLL